MGEFLKKSQGFLSGELQYSSRFDLIDMCHYGTTVLHNQQRSVIVNSALCPREVIRHFQINSVGEQWDRLKLPLFDSEKHIVAQLSAKLSTNWKLLNICVSDTKGSRVKTRWVENNILYHCANIPYGTNRLLVTLGIPSVWRIWQSGYPCVVGILGKQLDKKHEEFIDRVIGESGSLWVVTSGDKTSIKDGEAMAARLAKIRLTRYVHVADDLPTSPMSEIQQIL